MTTALSRVLRLRRALTRWGSSRWSLLLGCREVVIFIFVFTLSSRPNFASGGWERRGFLENFFLVRSLSVRASFSVRVLELEIFLAHLQLVHV
jgi:hypothetical protein